MMPPLYIVYLRVTSIVVSGGICDWWQGFDVPNSGVIASFTVFVFHFQFLGLHKKTKDFFVVVMFLLPLAKRQLISFAV